MRKRLLFATATLLMPLLAAADGPRPGEYACTEMKGSWLPCTPRHLYLYEGEQWHWGPANSKDHGDYKVHGRHLKFNGRPHGPVTWGAASSTEDSVTFTDKKVAAIFTRQGEAQKR